jgi:hypothetical protein
MPKYFSLKRKRMFSRPSSQFSPQTLAVWRGLKTSLQFLENSMQTLRSKKLAAGLFSLLLALFLCAPEIALAQSAAAATTPPPQTEQARATLPPRQYIPNRNYDTRHIKLDLHFDWEREQALGTATITFAPLSANTQAIEFDAANMSFSAVKLAQTSFRHSA